MNLVFIMYTLYVSLQYWDQTVLDFWDQIVVQFMFSNIMGSNFVTAESLDNHLTVVTCSMNGATAVHFDLINFTPLRREQITQFLTNGRDGRYNFTQLELIQNCSFA